jgi:hypothetical protein
VNCLNPVTGSWRTRARPPRALRSLATAGETGDRPTGLRRLWKRQSAIRVTSKLRSSSNLDWVDWDSSGGIAEKDEIARVESRNFDPFAFPITIVRCLPADIGVSGRLGG